MSTNEIAGSFVALRGEKCNFTTIGGVKSLTSHDGTDIMKIAETVGNELTVLRTTVAELVGANKILQEEIEILKGQTASLDPTTLETLRGEVGPDGADGRDGLQGPPGPKGARGPKGSVEQLRDVKDVDLNGLADKAVLSWSASKKKWIPVVYEDA